MPAGIRCCPSTAPFRAALPTPHCAIPSQSQSSGGFPRRAGAAGTGCSLLPSPPLHPTTPCTSAGAGAPPGQGTGLELQVRQEQGAQRLETYRKPNTFQRAET